MKYIIVIGDGMADNPVESLGGKTPLEAAAKPFIDRLAGLGVKGNALTVPEGVAPGSDTAILNIMGYDPRKFYSGRSPLEAAGCGVIPREGEVSFRCNMVAFGNARPEAGLEGMTILSHSGGSIDAESSIELINYLINNERFGGICKAYNLDIHPTPSFRHIAVGRGMNIDGISLIPPHDHLGEQAGQYLPSSEKQCSRETAARLCELMRLGHELLDSHPINSQRRAEGKLPANGIWFWAEGTGVTLPNIREKYGKTGFVVSAVPLVQGIGRLGGMDSFEVEGATGELDTNFEAKADMAFEKLMGKAHGFTGEKQDNLNGETVHDFAGGKGDDFNREAGYDFAVLHIEAPDECTHNGDLEGKLQAIEWLDSRCIRRLCEKLDGTAADYRMLILSDHKTLTSTRGHDGDPVPFILYDSRKSGQGESAYSHETVYSEKCCENGVYVGEGHRLIEMLFEM